MCVRNHIMTLTLLSIASNDARVTPELIKWSRKSAQVSLSQAVKAGRLDSQKLGGVPFTASSTINLNCLNKHQSMNKRLSKKNKTKSLKNFKRFSCKPYFFIQQKKRILAYEHDIRSLKDSHTDSMILIN